MTAGVQVQKFNYVFQWFDQNGDGWLTQDDFEQMAKLFTNIADEGDHKNRNAMQKAFMHWWDILLKSSDHRPSEKIGRQEFIGIMYSNVIAPEHFENAVGGIVDGLIGALDRDGNGSLSLEEYVRLYDALGVPPSITAEAFKRLDRDGSGELSYDEFRQAIIEFYLSTDMNSPSNWMLGALSTNG